eukprot:2726982-Pleurochrysis_carterae.AAC.1
MAAVNGPMEGNSRHFHKSAFPCAAKRHKERLIFPFCGKISATILTFPVQPNSALSQILGCTSRDASSRHVVRDEQPS